MNPTQKSEAIKKMNTDALRTILNTLADQERAEPGDPRYPLAGLVHLSGIGQVSVRSLRAELARRGEQVA
jgi:hypothetical protein